MDWDPQQYARYRDERSRPFRDLVARIAVERPRTVIDLGCGTGELTALLSARWPGAEVRGVDSSPEMIAESTGGARLRFEVGDLRDEPGGADVTVSNAALQWVPDHRAHLARWAAAVPPGGVLAWQVPGNFDAPSHRLLREAAAAPPWADRLAGTLRHHDAVVEPAQCVDVLAGAGLTADVWETTYLHVLPGPDAVLEWMRGTGLRPVLAALPPDEAASFERHYADLLRAAYPPQPYGTVLPYRRIFAVGHR